MRRGNRQGFTLLEVMVATTIMAIAVVALLGGLTQSTTNAAKLREREIVVALAKQQLNELLLEPRLPHARLLEGVWEPRQLGPGMKAGWTVRLTPMTMMAPEFAPPPGIRPRLQLVPVQPMLVTGPNIVLDRLILEAWWNTAGGQRRTLTFETYKRNWLVPGE
jgi:prepilin-type N-terminal cleavage/methylation domain-containing protein